MKLKKNTIILTIVAILIGFFVYLDETKRQQRQQMLLERQQTIFQFEDGKIAKLTIEKSDGNLEFIFRDRKWEMLEPESTIVNNGTISFLLDLITKGESNRILAVSKEQLAQYGLEPPQATITIGLSDGTQQKILLGQESVNPNLIYARIVSPEKPLQTEILLVSKNWHYAIERELGEWKNDVGS